MLAVARLPGDRVSYRVDIGYLLSPDELPILQRPFIGEWLSERSGWKRVQSLEYVKVRLVKSEWRFDFPKFRDHFDFEDEHHALEFKLRFG